MKIQYTAQHHHIRKMAFIMVAIFLFPCIAAAGSFRHTHRHTHAKVVQCIGSLSGDLADAITEQVTIVPFSKRIKAHRTPIIYRGGLFVTANGNAGGLRRAERRAIQTAYHSGQTIVIVDASVHDIEALHVLLGEGVVHDSDTDPVKAAYTLRKVNSVPTARVLTYARQAPFGNRPSDADGYGDVDDAVESRILTRAVDMVVYDLFPPADTVAAEDQPCGGSGESACWTDTPLQSTILAINASSGVFNTTFNVYALHECSTGNDQYVVTTEADWTATEAKFQSASTTDGSLSIDGNANLHIDWHDGSEFCSGGTELFLGQSICRYADYPLQYSVTVLPPATGTVIQKNAAPAATQGTGTTYSSGITINIGGSVNISGNGPSAGIQAGVAWSNRTTVTVPSLLVKAGDKGNEGAFWDYVYCTENSGTGPAGSETCVSNVQMVGNAGLDCQAFEMGTPQNGQTPTGRLSATGQSVQFVAEPDTRVGDTFDIDVTFTADMATTTTNLWYGPFLNDPGLYCAQNGEGPEGHCNCFGCSCKATTEKNPVTAKHTFKIPFPSTQCTQI